MQEVAGKAEQFQIVYDALVRVGDTFVSDALKTIAFVIIAIGWIMTSTRSREFLQQNALAFWAALVTIPVVALIHVGLMLERFEASALKLELLHTMKYVPTELYEHDGITWKLFSGNLILAVVLFAALWLLVYSTRSRKNSA